ncbi:MAG: DUF222 domain-containing protein [Ilumatobacter sp.]|uniref:HNH endonuclease signature motif containing protein n=1 Tax=Ilumatobacter sp. TaxID=1967498 RepID=UPI00391A1C17
MEARMIAEGVEELERLADPTPAVTAATRAMRRQRAEQLDEVHAVVTRGEFYQLGYRSPTSWLAVTTGEGIGHCTGTILLADRIQHMPIVKSAFAGGGLAESNLRLLCDAWCADLADTFARDEAMLCGWATSLPHRDFKLVLDTWRMHADPDREERTAQERFDARALHLSGLMDGMGRLDGTLDPESLALVREAIRALSQPADGETRTAAQRRADALTEMARITIANLTPEPGKKRRKPKVIATIAYDDLLEGTKGGVLDTDLDATVVGAETIRRMACDCHIHRYITNPLGTVIDYGRRRRVVPDTLFDTLIVRDHGCRWQGCGIPAGSCDAHHAIHWLDGGTTKPDNLVLLCWFHHHLLHEQHWSIEPLGGGHFTLKNPHGESHPLRPPLVGLALPT